MSFGDRFTFLALEKLYERIIQVRRTKKINFSYSMGLNSIKPFSELVIITLPLKILQGSGFACFNGNNFISHFYVSKN